MRPYLTTIKAITLLVFLSIFLVSIQLLHKTQNPPSKMSHLKQNTIIDPYEFLHIAQNLGGSITRLPEFYPTISASTTNSSSPSLSKDVVLNPIKNTRVRIYLPRVRGSNNKLPIVVFVHGGGFVLCSVGTPVVHEFCSNAASKPAALVISVDYRLTPENRLPAAYDDVLEALTWVKDGKDEWVKEYGNFSNCVLMGESAGGNIVYHTGLMVAVKIDDLRPLILRGLVLIQPYFGGLNRTGSELHLVNDESLPLVANDLMWELSLPVGSNRSHEYCDPFVGGGSSFLGRVRDLGWPIGVVACDGDPLIDRNVEFVKLLERKGLNMRTMIDKGGYHGMFVSKPHKMKLLFNFVSSFLS